MADQELAQRERERARKRELEQSDDSDHDVSKHARSPSYDSVSTISTRGPSSPSRRKVSTSQSRSSGAIRSSSAIRRSSRRRSFDSGSNYDSPSPKGHTRGIKSPEPTRRRARSSSRSNRPQHGRFDPDEQPADRRRVDGQRRRYSHSPSQSPPSENRRRYRSRSPPVPSRSDTSPPRYNDRPGPPPPGRNGREQRGAPKRNVRERSLSPFSKRLALTQAMNADR